MKGSERPQEEELLLLCERPYVGVVLALELLHQRHRACGPDVEVEVAARQVIRPIMFEDGLCLLHGLWVQANHRGL